MIASTTPQDVPEATMLGTEPAPSSTTSSRSIIRGRPAAPSATSRTPPPNYASRSGATVTPILGASGHERHPSGPYGISSRPVNTDRLTVVVSQGASRLRSSA
ncbi:hypothetical protein GCM10009754_46050 [Amycolatopsis minnesotensis]|uniref:Uncharacterized protein n=1 Tax=Amycolatopsis minnesotensis TaxID=337894 RepID=A0ABP5CS22_9PSEU